MEAEGNLLAKRCKKIKKMFNFNGSKCFDQFTLGAEVEQESVLIVEAVEYLESVDQSVDRAACDQL